MLKKVYRKLRSIEKQLLDKRQKQQENLMLDQKLATYSQQLAPLPVIEKKIGKKNILFFVPEAGVQPHFISTSILAKNMQAQGHQVFVIRCFDAFERCPTLSMYDFPTENVTPKDKQKLCATCIETHQDYLAKYNLNALDMRHFISKDEKQQIKEALAQAPADLQDFVYENINFGQLTAYEMVLNTKVSHFDDNLSLHNRTIWLQLIQTAITSYVATRNVYQFYAFDLLLSHNFYVGSLGASLIAKSKSVPYLFFSEAGHNNIDRSKYHFTAYKFWQGVVHWTAWQHLALLPQQVHAIHQDVLSHFWALGSHQVSPSIKFGNNTELLAQLKLPKDRKILVAYNSSEDETAGYNYIAPNIELPKLNESHNAFASQIEWLKEIIEFAESSSIYYLIIRLHPRLGKNKRDNKISTHYQELKQHLNKPFKNVRVILPEEQLSSYRLLDFADLVLVSWSSLSIDTTRLGIPTLSYTKRIATFPTDDTNNFVDIATTKADYFAKIAELVQQKPTINKIKFAMRWYAMRNLGNCIDMSDLVTPTQQDLPNFKPAREADFINRVIEGKTTTLAENYRRLQAMQSKELELQEQESIKLYLRRFIHFSFTGDSFLDKDLALQYIFTQEIDQVEQKIADKYNPFKAYLLTNGKDVKYHYLGTSYELYSPLCANLAALL
jgi:hypothetical protein